MNNAPDLVIEIIDINAHFIVAYKPENMNFHDEQNMGHGFFNRVKRQLALTELYPVHRLDKMTSGLVILAKTLAAAQAFQQLFEQHHIEKYYLAISDKKPTKKQGLIKGDMTKSRRGTWKLLRSVENPAISQFFSYTIMAGQRLYIVKPHSGKTHQIRVALSSIGAPIVGDNSYHSQSMADRGYLHAYAIKFTLFGENYHYHCLPKSGELFTLPSTQEKITQLQQPWTLAWPKIKASS